MLTDEELLAMRDRIRFHGINVYGHMDHGFCKSIYFAGPENLLLEVSTSPSVIDARAWIDPDVVKLVGISPEELARYKVPKSFTPSASPVPQPLIDPAKPSMIMDAGLKGFMADLSDEELAEASRKFADPPVKVPA
ncbi:hypothetical protein HY78_29025 (plasmid) [Rhizorhabdus wittichii DC-6]|nr:hypothetical protein HY78_29025 [Rhizorhabdus wittichii DC-6]